MTSGEKNRSKLVATVTPPSQVFWYEWHGKDLRDTECVRVASKGLTERHFCASVQWPTSRRVPPPRVFCKKKLDLPDCKGVDFFGSAKESAIVCRERIYVGETGGFA